MNIIASDPEGLKVTMSFIGQDKLPCKCMKITQKDSTFQIDID
jgi:hypothetical protein